MSGKVILKIVHGPMKGEKYKFDEHDTFLFGRMNDCHVCLPDDPMVSRHHFIMEVNPPDANICDLGSLNGTYISGTKHGGREPNESPEEGAKRRYDPIILKDKDVIQVGDTAILFSAIGPAVCNNCGVDIPDNKREECAWIGGTFICMPCKEKLIASAENKLKPKAIKCKKCGKEVLSEAGIGRKGDYICNSCRRIIESDPVKMVGRILQQNGKPLSPQSNAFSIRGYEIQDQLGVGAFGAVYMGYRKADNKKVAIKIMLSKIAVEKNSRNRFFKEIESMKCLSHKNIVSYIDHGSIDGAFYFIMEHCNGGSIADLMEKQRSVLKEEIACKIILQALEGLDYAHKKGFVHRDIKPGNILMDDTGKGQVVKIADFGLAKNFEKAGFSGMTITGSAAGTPTFMPREQVTNFKYVKPISDIWSMGATLYFMLTGKGPRNFRNGINDFEVILRESVIPIRKRNSDISKKIANVIDQSLEDNLKKRYKSAIEFHDELRSAI